MADLYAVSYVAKELGMPVSKVRYWADKSDDITVCRLPMGKHMVRVITQNDYLKLKELLKEK